MNTYYELDVHAAGRSRLDFAMDVMEDVHILLDVSPPRGHLLLGPFHDHRPVLLVEVLALVELFLDARPVRAAGFTTTELLNCGVPELVISGVQVVRH